MFQTNRLIIRPYTMADARAVLSTMGEYEIYKTTYGIPYPCNMRYVRGWIKNIINSAITNRSYEYAVINKADSAYIGNVGLINIDEKNKRCDISYFINPKYHNKGFATEASAVMVQYAFKHLGMNRVGGMCMEHNLSSAKVMEKLGMTYEGTLRNYFIKENNLISVKNYSILSEEYKKLCTPHNN